MPACASLEVGPESCLFVDDVAANVEAAQAAGMQAHLFEDNIGTITRIAAHLDAGPLTGLWLADQGPAVWEITESGGEPGPPGPAGGGAFPCETAGHEGDGGPGDQGLGVLDEPFVVAGMPAGVHHPRE